MAFNLYEIAAIIRAILSADERLWDLKEHSDINGIVEDLAVIEKFHSACQECPGMIGEVRNIINKLQTVPKLKKKRTGK